jgi:hypothetical protein
LYRTSRQGRLLLALLLAAAGTVVPVQTRAAPIWKLQLDSPVRWFKTSPPGVFLVGTGREILGVEPDSGNVLWRMGPFKDSNPEDVELLANCGAALFNVGIQGAPASSPVSVIDLRSGHTLWTCEQQQALRSIGSLLIPGTDHLLVRATTSADGSKKTAMLVSLASGVPIWTSESLGNDFEPVLPFWYKTCLIRSHQVAFMDTDSSMVFHMRDGMFQRIDLKTGMTVWTAQGKHVAPYTNKSDQEHRAANPTSQMTYNVDKQQVEWKDIPEEDEDREMEFDLAPMLESSSGDRLYAPYQCYVVPFSMVSGECLWEDPPRLEGEVAQMEETSAGLLVRTVEPVGKELQHRVLLLDAQSGVVRWRWPKKGGRFGLSVGYWTDATNFLVEGDRVVIAAEGKLRSADLAQGREKTLAKLDFDGTDDARTLLSVPRGYSVIGRSNLGIYAKEDGHCTKKYYRAPPDELGFGLALLALSAVTMGWVDPKLGLDTLLGDLSASEERENYAYFLADLGVRGRAGPGIVRVERETGDVAGEIYLGTKAPVYALDSRGRLYFKSGPKTIECYRF